MFFEFLDPLSTFLFCFSVLEPVNTCSPYQLFWGICANSQPKNWMLRWKNSILLEDSTLQCLSTVKLEQLDFKKLKCGTFANSYYWMLPPGIVQNVVVKKSSCVSFVEKPLWSLFVKWIKIAQIETFLFNKHQLFLRSKFYALILSMV